MLSKWLNKIRNMLRDLILQHKLITIYLEIDIIVNNKLSLIITRLILSVIYYNAVFCYLKSPQCDVSVNSKCLILSRANCFIAHLDTVLRLYSFIHNGGFGGMYINNFVWVFSLTVQYVIL